MRTNKDLFKKKNKKRKNYLFKILSLNIKRTRTCKISTKLNRKYLILVYFIFQNQNKFKEEKTLYKSMMNHKFKKEKFLYKSMKNLKFKNNTHQNNYCKELKDLIK